MRHILASHFVLLEHSSSAHLLYWQLLSAFAKMTHRNSAGTYALRRDVRTWCICCIEHLRNAIAKRPIAEKDDVRTHVRT